MGKQLTLDEVIKICEDESIEEEETRESNERI